MVSERPARASGNGIYYETESGGAYPPDFSAATRPPGALAVYFHRVCFKNAGGAPPSVPAYA